MSSQAAQAPGRPRPKPLAQHVPHLTAAMPRPLPRRPLAPGGSLGPARSIADCEPPATSPVQPFSPRGCAPTSRATGPWQAWGVGLAQDIPWCIQLREFLQPRAGVPGVNACAQHRCPETGPWGREGEHSHPGKLVSGGWGACPELEGSLPGADSR